MQEISVVYADGMMDMVPASQLQSLIDGEDIIKFQRQDGWVYLGVDPVRIRPAVAYRGPERRLN